MAHDKKIRINKYLSLSGLGSRRKVEEYILNGKIRINGKIVTDLSQLVDIKTDRVELKNKSICPLEKRYYLLLNKPRGYITTLNDELGRPIVMDLIPDIYKRAMLAPVGRLDKESEGLLLFTNDGDLAYKLTHPKFGITKEYIVELNRPVDEYIKAGIERGVILYGKRTNPARIDFIDKSHKIIKMIINEGKKRHIRVIFENYSYRVKKLKRISYGPIKLGKVASGSFRLLKEGEIRLLLKAVSEIS